MTTSPFSASAPAVVRVRIDEADAGQRIDNYLLRVCKGVPKSHVYRILRSGAIRPPFTRTSPLRRMR